MRVLTLRLQIAQIAIRNRKNVTFETRYTVKNPNTHNKCLFATNKRKITLATYTTALFWLIFSRNAEK